ncbi:hypothetical protein GCM10028808_64440 [Spirosoma migulaei]
MKSQKIQNMSREALLKQKKSIKFLTGLLSGALLMLFAITLYQTLTRGFTTFLVVPFGLLPILVLTANNLKQINQELVNRNE